MAEGKISTKSKDTEDKRTAEEPKQAEAPAEEPQTGSGINQPEPVVVRRTAIDADGTERVVPGGDPRWEPAPVEPSEAQREASKRFEEAEKARAERRQAPSPSA